MKYSLLLAFLMVLGTGHAKDVSNNNKVISIQNDLIKEYGEPNNSVGVLKLIAINDHMLDLTINVDQLPFVQHVDLCPNADEIKNLVKVTKDKTGKTITEEFDVSKPNCDSLISIEKVFDDKVYLTLELVSLDSLVESEFNGHDNLLPSPRKFYSRVLLSNDQESLISQTFLNNKLAEEVRAQFTYVDQTKRS